MPALAAGALLLALAGGACTLSSDPASDSLGRLGSGAASPGESGPSLTPADPDAPTLHVDAPAAKVAFEPAKLDTEADVLNVRFTTDGNHNLTLLGRGFGEALLWGARYGSPVDVTHAVALEPGTYEYYCSVPGHREAGMRGTLVVK